MFFFKKSKWIILTPADYSPSTRRAREDSQKVTTKVQTK